MVERLRIATLTHSAVQRRHKLSTLVSRNFLVRFRYLHHLLAFDRVRDLVLLQVRSPAAEVEI